MIVALVIFGAGMTLAFCLLLAALFARKAQLKKCSDFIVHQAAEIGILKVQLLRRAQRQLVVPRTVMLRNAEVAIVNDTMPGSACPLRGFNSQAPFLAWKANGSFMPHGTPHPLDIVAVQLVQDGPFLPVPEHGVLELAEFVKEGAS